MWITLKHSVTLILLYLLDFAGGVVYCYPQAKGFLCISLMPGIIYTVMLKRLQIPWEENGKQLSFG